MNQVVVSNSTPLIALARIRRLDLLPALYGDVLVPLEVWNELVVRGRGYPGAAEIRDATWIATKTVRYRDRVIQLAAVLDQGEAEAIALAIEHDARLVLLDDRSARREALRRGLHVQGTLGILLRAKRLGLVPALAPVMDALRHDAGFYFAESLRRRVLEAAGEGEA